MLYSTLNNFQVSELGPMGENANLNPDLTTVTWTSEEKDEIDIIKDDIHKAAEKDDIAMKEKEDDSKDAEPEKKDDEKIIENETTPLHKED